MKRVELLAIPDCSSPPQDTEAPEVTFRPDKPCDFVYSLKITGMKIPPRTHVSTT